MSRVGCLSFSIAMRVTNLTIYSECGGSCISPKHTLTILLDNHDFLILLDKHRCIILLDNHGSLLEEDGSGEKGGGERMMGEGKEGGGDEWPLIPRNKHVLPEKT